MKWGRKKSALPSSSSPISAISRVFPVSWFANSNQRVSNSQSKNKRSSPFDFPTPKSSGCREGRFYSMGEEDSFWRLSFSDERIQGRRSTGGINPLWYDYDNEFHAPVSGFKSFESTLMEAPRRDQCRNFSEMVSDIKKIRERRGKQRMSDDNGAFAGKTGESKTGVSTRRGKDEKDRLPRKYKGLDDGEEKISNSGERDIFPIKHKLKTNTSTNRATIKPHSPRTECKIRALEDMKKARTRSKTRKKRENAGRERILEGNTVFDSFAVVKSSYNPQRDFRVSMTEMILEKGIGHPQDLEELLACYLTLNCDEYHGMIIKVFRQVWLELKGLYIDPTLRNGAVL